MEQDLEPYAIVAIPMLYNIFIQNFNNHEVDIKIELEDAKIILGKYEHGKMQKFETIVIKK